jgi:spermidine synthase
MSSSKHVAEDAALIEDAGTDSAASDLVSGSRQAAGYEASLPVVALLVFTSGCAALVFQVAWMRELRLVFGATTAAVAAVLAIFMAGLGVGSAVLGKRADRAANPLRMYGLLEVAIAVCVAVSPWLIDWIGALYIGLGGQEALGLAGATAARLALAALVMAVPTFLMGGTLPAAVKAVTPASDAHRGALAVLYGSNTLGAVFGTAAATFLALERLGTRATLWAGCAIGLAAGAAATTLSRKLSSSATSNALDDNFADRLSTNERAHARSTGVGARPYLVYITAAVLGFTFFALELVWYRMLGPILGGTAFTFGLILCLALVGIGVGGIGYELVFRRLRPTWSALAITCACEAIFTILPFAVGDRLALWAAVYRARADSFLDLIAGWSVVAGIVVLPVALVSGLQFPLVVALLGQGPRRVSKHLGMTYAWNTLGAIAGSLVAGFGAMPLLGAPGLWKLIAGILALLSVAILMAAPQMSRKAALGVTVLAVATFGAMFADGPTAAWRHSGIGVGRTIDFSKGPNVVRQWMNEHRQTLAWETDGIESSIAINSWDGLSFIVNGKSDGNGLTDAATQVGIAILGGVLHQAPKTALVIGLGTGETAGWLAEMDGLERVDVVELEPAIDEMARRSSELNHNVLAHPRVRRIYNDGREFVLTTKNTYDLMISEPSNPYRAGVATLYTTEFYRAVRKRLNPNGLFMQWLQAYDVDARTVNTVLATARDVFPHVEVWQTMPNDLQLVCSMSPLNYSAAQLRERIASPTISRALAESWHVYDFEGFLAHYMAAPAWADEITRQGGAPLNTDDRTLLEYRFAKTLGRGNPFSVEAVRKHLAGMHAHQPALGGEAVDWNTVELRRQEFNLLFQSKPSGELLPDTEDAALIKAFEAYQAGDYAGVVARWPAKYREPASPIQRMVLARSYAELGRPDCLAHIAVLESQFPIEAAAINAVFYSQIGNVPETTKSLEAFYTMLGKSPWLVTTVADAALIRTTQLAEADQAAAEQLYPLVSRPLASYRFDYLRKLVRFYVAQKLGAEKTIEALAELEPHMRWTEDVLRPRAEIYTMVNHPFAARAQREWQQFRRDAPAK